MLSTAFSTIFSTELLALLFANLNFTIRQSPQERGPPIGSVLFGTGLWIKHMKKGPPTTLKSSFAIPLCTTENLRTIP